MLSVAAYGADVAVAPLAPPASSDWTITLGVEGRVLPDFEGSQSYILRPWPLFSIRRADTPARFRGPRDGASIALIDTGAFFLGPVGKLRSPRYESDDSALRGLGDIGWGLELGAFAEYWPAQWLRTRGELRQGIGTHRGIVAELTSDIVVPLAADWTLSGGPRLTLATGSALQPYFGITPAQALASGLPVFNTGSGVRAAGAGVQARYQWSPQWAVHSYVEYDRLMGDAASSPLVTMRGSADQITFGAGATYSFNIRGW